MGRCVRRGSPGAAHRWLDDRRDATTTRVRRGARHHQRIGCTRSDRPMGDDLGTGRARRLLRRDRVRTGPSTTGRPSVAGGWRNVDRPCRGVSPADPRQLGGAHCGGNGCVCQPGCLAGVCGESQVELGAAGNAPLGRGDGKPARTHRVVRCRDSRRSARTCRTVCGRRGVLMASGGGPHHQAGVETPTGTRA